MCTQKRQIVNPTLVGSEFTKYHLFVPCGKCSECRATIQNEWFVRSYAEYRDCVDNGGRVLFVTLTYSNKCLPHLFINYKNKETGQRVSYTVSSFNRNDVDQFNNSFGRFVKSFGGQPHKFLFCSEKGEITKRPHYHALLFVPGTYFCSFDSINQGLSLLRQKLYDFWHKGFIGFGSVTSSPQLLDSFSVESVNNARMCINSDSGIRYVSKYVTKDLSFYDSSDNPTLSDDILNYLNSSSESVQKYIKDRLPFHSQSPGLGISLFNRILDEYNKGIDILPYFTDGIDLHLRSDLQSYTAKLYPLPKYIKDKLFYTRDVGKNSVSSGRQILTELGKSLKMRLLIHNVDYIINRIKEFTSYSKFYSLVNDTDISIYFKNLGLTSVSSLYDLVINNIPKSLDDFAYWKLIYKGQRFHRFTRVEQKDSIFDYIDNLNTLEFKDFSEKFYLSMIDPEPCDWNYRESDYGYFNSFSKKHFGKTEFTYKDDHFVSYRSHQTSSNYEKETVDISFCSRFEGFEYFDGLVDKILQVHSNNVYSAKKLLYDKTKLIKSRVLKNVC